MSDDSGRDPRDAPEPEAMSPGLVMLAQAALTAPPPDPDAEAASRQRALTAYQESLTTPRPLHDDPWRPGPPSLAARLGRLFRRGR